MSLRLRLLVAVGLIAVVALVVADFATYSALRSSLYQQVDQNLAGVPPGPHVDRVTGILQCSAPQSVTGGSGGEYPGGGQGGPNVSGYLYSAYVSQNGSVINGLECPAYVGDHAYRPQLPSPITGFTTQPDGTQETYFTTGPIDPSGPNFRVRAVLAQGGGVLVDAQPLVNQDSTLHTLFLTELAVTAAAVVLALLGGWWLVRLGLRPLEDVERTADSIAAGDLDQRVPGAEEATEVGRLARALNVMLERIQAAFSARLASESRLRENEQHLRQFVADASHELRTPIAAVSAYAELFERGGAEHADDLPRIAAGIRTETARMDRLVSDLLILARLDEGLPMEMAPVELVSLASEAVRTAGAVGPEWPVQFRASRPVEVVGDKDRLRQVMDNLLANVRAHTPSGTSTSVRLEEVDGEAEIEVRDGGPGMPADQARRIFERFYRADPARARTRGGSGLGLSIVAAIVEAHGGTVSATSAPGEGMVVTVRLPLAAQLPAEPASGVAGESAPPASSDGSGPPSTAGPAAASGPSSTSGPPAAPGSDLPDPLVSPERPLG